MDSAPTLALLQAFLASHPSLTWPFGCFPAPGNSPWTTSLVSGPVHDYGWEGGEGHLHGAEDTGRQDCYCESLMWRRAAHSEIQQCHAVGYLKGPCKENRKCWGLSLWSVPMEQFSGVLWHLSSYQTIWSGSSWHLSAITCKIRQKFPQTHRWRGQATGEPGAASDETSPTTEKFSLVMKSLVNGITMGHWAGWTFTPLTPWKSFNNQ